MATPPHLDIFEELGFDSKRVRIPESAVLYALARTYHLVERRLAALYQPFGLTVPSFNLLVLLARGKDPESFSQQAIGQRLVVSPSNMTGLIDRLEKRGLVRRVPGPDRRTKLLRITEQGRKLVEEVWPHHAKLMGALSEQLTKTECRSLNAALTRLRHIARSG